MASKFGEIVERLTGAEVFFAPDGSNLGTVETPDLVTKTNKPSGAEWDDYNLGRVTTAKYDPKTKDRTREWGLPTGGFKVRTDTIVIEDAFDFTMIDFAATLFDQLMFGMETEPVDNVSQQVFKSATRYKDGWIFLKRYNEDGSILCKLELHVRLTLKTIPEDKNEPGSPVLRVAHLADGAALDTIIFNPA